MSKDPGNKRKHERIYFDNDMRAECTISLDSSESSRILGLILNLSEGGMHFVQERQGMKKIRKGDRIILKTVNGLDPLKVNKDVEMQVMWVLDHRSLRNVGYGCKFLNLPQEMAELIRIMVAGYVLVSKDG